MNLRRAAVIAVATALLGACGQATTSPRGANTMEPVLVVGSGTVLDDGSGPELCLGAVALSYPPQCGGPKLVGWSWPEGGTERAADITWIDGVALLGRYDGSTFTVVRTLARAERDALPDPDEARDLSAPCPEPPGGWVAPDPARATERDFEAVATAAHDLDDYADSWIDDTADPTYQDRAKIVYVVRVARDVAGAERTLRAVWGGSLCVTKASFTDNERRKVQDEVSKTPGMLSAGVSDGVVELEVTYDDGSLQRSMDATYGDGVVRVTSALVRAPDGME